MKLIVAVGVWLAVAACVAATPPFIGPSYATLATTTISQEALSYQINTYVDNDLAAKSQNMSTPNGGGAQTLIVNKSNPANSALYTYYKINGVMMCEKASPMAAQYPFPQVPLPTYYKVKEGILNGKVGWWYNGNAGRYVRRYFSDVELRTNTSAPFFFATTNQIAMDQTQTSVIYNSSDFDASVFDLPAECTDGHPRLRHRHVDGLTAEDVDAIFHPVAFTAAAAKLYPGRLKFNIVSKTGEEEFWREVRRARRALGPSRFSEYAPRVTQNPPSVDNSPYATYIRDQGTCGCCWTMSSAAATEVVSNKKNNYIPSTSPSTSDWFAPQMFIDCVHNPYDPQPNGTDAFPSNGCGGGWPFAALTHVVQSGINKEMDYPYDSANGNYCKQSQFKSYFPLSGAQYIPYTANTSVNVPLLESAVAEHGAAIAIMNADPILFYGGGYIFNTSCPPSFGHAVTLVGYGTDSATGLSYWKVKNSFGAAWGEAGYFRIAKGVNLCGIEQMGIVAISA